MCDRVEVKLEFRCDRVVWMLARADDDLVNDDGGTLNRVDTNGVSINGKSICEKAGVRLNRSAFYEIARR